MCLIAFALVFKVYSQTDTFAIGRNQIHFSPLRLIDVVNPGLELGYERLFQNQYSTQLSAASMFDPFGMTNFLRYHGYRLALEEKHFFRRGRVHKTYLSLEAVYNHVHFGQDYYENAADTIRIHKYTVSLNCKYGWQIYLNKHLMMDIGFGLGIKYYNARIAYRHDAFADDLVVPAFHIFDDIASRPSHYFTVNVPFNIKFGYSF